MPGATSVIDVLALLPHRYPMLLVDRIIEVVPGQRARGVKRVTGAEWSAGAPAGLGTPGAMPHLLVIEALAQLSAALLAGLAAGEGAVGYFMGIDRVRLRGAALAGDELALSVQLKQFRRGVCSTVGVARVSDRLIASAELTTIVRPVATAPAAAR